MELLKIAGVSKVYYNEAGQRVEALLQANLDVRDGEFISLVGPSGCGKTTLLEIVAGLLEPTEGFLTLKGQPLKLKNHSLGVVFQEDSVFPWRNVLQNVEFGLEAKGFSSEERRVRSLEMIELVGLRGFERSYPAELSGGMRQRVAIARALALNPDLLLLDEPFGALDEQTRFLLGEELQRIWMETGKTILLVTHSINEAVFLSDRVVVLCSRPGSVIADLSVNIPRPRSIDTLGLVDFGHLTSHIWTLLRQSTSQGGVKAHASI